MLFNQPRRCYRITWYVMNADVTSWAVLVIWEEKVWIHPLSCRKSWGRWNTSKDQTSTLFFKVRHPLCHWFDSWASHIPVLLCHFHPMHAGHRMLHWKHVEDLCFLNATQDHLLGVSKAEGQYWGAKGGLNIIKSFMLPSTSMIIKREM